MNIATPAAALSVLLALVAPPVSAAATDQKHPARADHHAGPARPAATAAPAKGWATDAPLRQGMARIRVSVAGLGHYQRGHMGAAQAVVLAGAVEKDVRFLIANCKLDPAADAALHGIIGPLLTGADAIKTRPADRSAIAPMRAALDQYARTFDDAAFRKAAAAD